MKRLHELVDLTVNDDHDLPDSDTIDLASSSDEDDQDELSSSIVKSFSKPGWFSSPQYNGARSRANARRQSHLV